MFDREKVAARIRQGCHFESQVQTGLTYAAEQGATSDHDAFELAISRILYSDDQLADGARFSAEPEDEVDRR